jgi:hypothetical protein
MSQAGIRAALAVIVAGIAPSSAQAAQATAFESIAAVPQDTASFVTFCHSHQELCTNAVTDVNNDTLIDMLYGKYGCPYPDVEGDTAAKRHLVHVAYAAKILAWLESNGSSRMATTKEAIKQATAALWPAQCEQGHAAFAKP